jgi:uncharacterized membrane protein YjgN (DUF898 family)
MTMTYAAAPPPAAAGPRPDAPVAFKGDGRAFLALSIRGAFLQLLTFGFYRFWLATDIRRRLWSHTSLEGEPLEYTGRGKELFIGFLFAMAILVPVNVAYFAVTLEAEEIIPFASLPFLLFFVVFGQFALFRARRYRLTRTVWRGLRFWMTGSGWNYAFRWLGWSIVTAITLGLAYPWMRASLERYKLANTHYGDLRGGFVGRGGDFFLRGFGFWLVGMTPLTMVIVGVILAFGPNTILKELEIDYAISWNPSPEAAIIGGFVQGIGGFVLLFTPLLWPFFRALEWRWWAQGVRFGDLSLTSKLSGWSVLGLYAKTFLVTSIVLFLMALALGAAVLLLFTALGLNATVFDPSNIEQLFNNIPMVVALAACYLVLLLALGVVTRFFLTYEKWGLLATSMTISHPEAADGAAARGTAVSGLEESLADSLDVAGF